MVTADKVIKVFGRPIGSKLLGIENREPNCGTEQYGYGYDMDWIAALHAPTSLPDDAEAVFQAILINMTRT